MLADTIVVEKLKGDVLHRASGAVELFKTDDRCGGLRPEGWLGEAHGLLAGLWVGVEVGETLHVLRGVVGETGVDELCANAASILGDDGGLTDARLSLNERPKPCGVAIFEDGGELRWGCFDGCHNNVCLRVGLTCLVDDY